MLSRIKEDVASEYNKSNQSIVKKWLEIIGIFFFYTRILTEESGRVS